jgi:hypothetical protein
MPWRTARPRATPGEGGALHLDIRFTGSVDAIRALNEGRCTLAGLSHARRTRRRFAGRAHLPPAAAAGAAQDHRLCAAHPGSDRCARQSAGPAHPWPDVARTGARLSTARWAPAPACCWKTCWRRPGSPQKTLRATTRTSLAHRRGAGRGGGRCRRGHGHRPGGPRARGWTLCPWCTSATTWPASNPRWTSPPPAPACNCCRPSLAGTHGMPCQAMPPCTAAKCWP